MCRRREVVPEKIKTLPRPACAFSRIFYGFESIGGAGDTQLAPGRKDDSSRPGRGYPPIVAARTRTEGVPPGFPRRGRRVRCARKPVGTVLADAISRSAFEIHVMETRV